MAKLWGGRFDGKNEAWIDAFGASITFDQKLAKQDILGSLAHVKMLVHTGIISQPDGEAIIGGLTTIQQQLAAGELTFTIENEDIHFIRTLGSQSPKGKQTYSYHAIPIGNPFPNGVHKVAYVFSSRRRRKESESDHPV